VLALSKRRRLSLLSLPIVTIAGFLVVARLAAWQRSDLIAELSDCIAHGETREAIEAVRKLAAMPNPPIEALVIAAAADEHETAEAGQGALSRLLRRWQRDIDTQQQTSTVSAHLSELAKSLAENLGEFSESDHAWLATTAGKILQLANTFPADRTPSVAIHCDKVLAAVTDRALARPAEVAQTDGTQTAAPEVEMLDSSPPANDANVDARSTSETNLEAGTTDLVSNALRRRQSRGESVYLDAQLNSKAAAQSGIDENARGGESAHSTTGEPDRGDSVGTPISDESSRKPDLKSNSESPGAVYRIVPPEPAQFPAAADNEFTRKAIVSNTFSSDSGKGETTTVEALAGIPSRELLRCWLAQEYGKAVLMSDLAHGSGSFAIPMMIDAVAASIAVEYELGRRGFGRLSARAARQYFSEYPQQRMQLVNSVAALPGAGPAAWLVLLADDADANVRLYAVTLMATSNNAALMEKAWQIALRDRDPRIADLAERLRSRRAGTLRR
jgi:hypothetical protein